MAAELLNAAADFFILATDDTLPASDGTESFIAQVVAPILGTGIVGALFLMVLFRIKIMPTYVHDEAKANWAQERTRLEADIAELKASLQDANEVYTQQVIPTLTRVLDAERELVELRRDEAAERRRRGTPA
jgi:hypothetical protein